jgi:hypothetical protein
VTGGGELPLRGITREDLQADFDALPTGELKREAAKMMLRLKRQPYLGQRLGVDARVGDLSDRRKLYFDEARHRVVYRLRPDELAPTEVEIIAVGPRADLEAYTMAAQRLGR